MAVATDNHSESHSGTSGSQNQTAFTWFHDINAPLACLLVFTFTNANADDANLVTFDGIPLTAIPGGRAVDTAGEPGDCKAWILESIPARTWMFGTGSQLFINFVDNIWITTRDISLKYTTQPLSPSWHTPIYSGSLPNTIYSVTKQGNVWVTSGSGAPYCSPNNINGPWAAASSDGFAGSIVWALAASSTHTVGGTLDSKLRYATDPTGTWSAVGSHGFTGSIDQIIYDLSSGTWLAVGAAGQMQYATNPTGTWTTPTSPGFGTNDIKDVTVYEGLWVAVGQNGSIRYATDPTGTWTAASSPGFGTSQIEAVATDGDYWVACTSDGKIRYAIDPRGTWTALSNNPFGGFSVSGRKRLVYGAGVWGLTDSTRAMFTNDLFYSPWLGSGRIIVERNNNSNEMYAVCISILTDTSLNNATGVVLIEGDGTMAEQSVDDGSPGTNSLRYAGNNSGLSGISDNPTTPGSNNLSRGANSTWLQNIDFGQRVIGVVAESVAGQGARSVGFRSTTSDDRAAVHLAIREQQAVKTIDAIKNRFVYLRKNR